MNATAFLDALADAINLEPGSITPTTDLTEMTEWDSLAVVEYQGLVADQWDVDVPPQTITACKTGADLLKIVEEHLEA